MARALIVLALHLILLEASWGKPWALPTIAASAAVMVPVGRLLGAGATLRTRRRLERVRTALSVLCLAAAGHFTGWMLPIWPLLALNAVWLERLGSGAPLWMAGYLGVFAGAAIADGVSPLIAGTFVILGGGVFHASSSRSRDDERRIGNLAELGLQQAEGEEAGHVGSWSMSSHDDVLRCSEELDRICGIDRATFDGTYGALLDLVHPEDRATFETMLGAAHDGSWSAPSEFRVVRPDGCIRWLVGRARVLATQDGAPSRILGVVRDETDRKELVDRLLVTDRLASIGTLAGGVAHEINNPLAYVVTNLEFLTAELGAAALTDGAERWKEVLETLVETRNGAERVRKIVRDLKTFARVEDDVTGAADVSEVLELSINMAAHEIRHRARLVRDYHPVPRVRGAAARLGQVVLNLLVNAAHAIPEGHSEANEIRVSTRLDPQGRVVVEVRDTGCGMAPQVRERIFDPFFSTKPIGRGMGLGLSICHSIVKAMGAEIVVESELGKGSVFRLLLAPAEETPEEPVHMRSHRPARRGRILIVDDEPMLARSLRRLLATEHEVLIAHSAAHALQQLGAGERFDLILCDLMMPDMTGMDFYDAVAQSHPDHLGRFVFMSGGAFTARAQTFLEKVSRPLLEKPIDRTALRAVVSALLVPPSDPPAPVRRAALPVARAAALT